MTTLPPPPPGQEEGLLPWLLDLDTTPLALPTLLMLPICIYSTGAMEKSVVLGVRDEGTIPYEAAAIVIVWYLVVRRRRPSSSWCSLWREGAASSHTIALRDK